MFFIAKNACSEKNYDFKFTISSLKIKFSGKKWKMAGKNIINRKNKSNFTSHFRLSNFSIINGI